MLYILFYSILYQWNGKFLYCNIEIASLSKSGCTYHGADLYRDD